MKKGSIETINSHEELLVKFGKTSDSILNKLL